MSTTTTTTTTAASHQKIELPPPAWGSPAHLAQRKAEKEWKTYLRAHASVDAAARKSGKQSKYVDGIDVVVRYTLPPAWEEVDAPGFKIKREGDAVWDLPEDDEELVKVLRASSQPFFQRTGEFSKSSPAFKTPPVAKSNSRKPSPTTSPTPTPAIALPDQTLPISKATTASQPPLPSATAPFKPYTSVAKEEDQRAVQPRRTYLPVALTNLFYNVGQMFLWFVPNFIRARLSMWWSPVHGKPPGYGQV